MRIPSIGPVLALLLGMPCLMPAPAAAADSVGTLAFARGTVTRFAEDGRRDTLERGDPVYNGETISTGARSLAFLTFTDKTRFNLGPNSSMKINQVKPGGDGIFSARVLRGAFRFVTGLIAKARPSSMRVQAGAVATIGIRGTTVGGEVEGDSATIVLLEPEGEATSSAVEVGNDFGSVVLDQPGFGTTVPDAHSPPSPPERMRLRALDNLIRNLGNMQRMSVPRPSFH